MSAFGGRGKKELITICDSFEGGENSKLNLKFYLSHVGGKTGEPHSVCFPSYVSITETEDEYTVEALTGNPGAP